MTKADTLIASTGDVAHCLNAGAMGRIDYESETMVAHALRGEGFDASEDGTGRGTPLVPVAFHNRQDPDVSGAVTHPLGAKDNWLAVAFSSKDYRGDAMANVAPTLRAGGHDGSHANAGVPPAIATPYAVRRLTPVECERLQGFQDGYTAIPYRGKPADRCPDGPRYKALGNSWAINCAEMIGERIGWIEGLRQGLETFSRAEGEG